MGEQKDKVENFKFRPTIRVLLRLEILTMDRTLHPLSDPLSAHSLAAQRPSAVAHILAGVRLGGSPGTRAKLDRLRRGSSRSTGILYVGVAGHEWQ